MRAELRRLIDTPQYNTWLRQMVVIAAAEQQVTVELPTSFHASHVRHNYTDLIERKLTAAAGRTIRVAFVVAPPERNAGTA